LEHERKLQEVTQRAVKEAVAKETNRRHIEKDELAKALNDTIEVLRLTIATERAAHATDKQRAVEEAARNAYANSADTIAELKASHSQIVEEARREEREACAKVASDRGDHIGEGWAAREIAQLIRQRADTRVQPDEKPAICRSAWCQNSCRHPMVICDSCRQGMSERLPTWVPIPFIVGNFS